MRFKTAIFFLLSSLFSYLGGCIKFDYGPPFGDPPLKRCLMRDVHSYFGRHGGWRTKRSWVGPHLQHISMDRRGWGGAEKFNRVVNRVVKFSDNSKFWPVDFVTNHIGTNGNWTHVVAAAVHAKTESCAAASVDRYWLTLCRSVCVCMCVLCVYNIHLSIC